MDNERYSSWNASPPIPRGNSPLRGMPQSGGARGMPDLNFPPEDQSFTEEPSNPQHGPSNPEERPNSPEQDPPDKSFFPDRVVNPPKPFFTGKLAGALEGMRKLIVRIRRRPKHKKEEGTPKRKYTRRGQQPKSETRRKRTKRPPGDDMDI